VQTERDAAIVEWIGRTGAAGAGHVMSRFGMGRSWTYARLSSLVAGRLLERRTLLHRQPGLYVATAKGLRWQRLERLGVYRVSPGSFEHACEVASAAARLATALPRWELLSERTLRACEADAGELVGSVRIGELPGGRPALHRPDLVIRSETGRTVAVEIELSVKAPKRLAAICRGYARARHLDRVYYLAAPPARRAVERAVRETRSGDRITVLDLADVSGLLDAERAAGG
jgi:hypothetical protein